MSQSNIESLLADLAADDGIARQHARHQLEAMGPAAEQALIDALGHDQDRMRWEAAKALTRVATGRAAQALVQRLDDENHGIRWLAAEALVRTGADGVEALLVALGQTPDEHGLDTLALREGAHHALHAQKDKALRALAAPVVETLRHSAKDATVPVAAAAALHELRAKKS